MHWQLDGTRRMPYTSRAHPEEMTFDQPSQNLYIDGCESHPWMSICHRWEEKAAPTTPQRVVISATFKTQFHGHFNSSQEQMNSEWQLVHPPRLMCTENPFKSKPKPVNYFSADWNFMSALEFKCTTTLGNVQAFWAKCTEMAKNFSRYWIWKQTSRGTITNTLGREMNPFAWDRALCALRCQASWWDWSQDLLPPTLLPTGTVSGPAPTVPVNQLAIPASKPHHSGVWTPCSSVWWLMIQNTDYQQLGFQFGPQLVQHIQLHFLSIKC